MEEKSVPGQIEGVEHSKIPDPNPEFVPPLELVMRKRLQMPAQLLDLSLDLRLDFRRQRKEGVVERRAVNLRRPLHARSRNHHAALALVKLILGAVQTSDKFRP